MPVFWAQLEHDASSHCWPWFIPMHFPWVCRNLAIFGLSSDIFVCEQHVLRGFADVQLARFLQSRLAEGFKVIFFCFHWPARDTFTMLGIRLYVFSCKVETVEKKYKTSVLKLFTHFAKSGEVERMELNPRNLTAMRSWWNFSNENHHNSNFVRCSSRGSAGILLAL